MGLAEMFGGDGVDVLCACAVSVMAHMGPCHDSNFGIHLRFITHSSGTITLALSLPEAAGQTPLVKHVLGTCRRSMLQHRRSQWQYLLAAGTSYDVKRSRAYKVARAVSILSLTSSRLLVVQPQMRAVHRLQPARSASKPAA